ncbi:phage tail-collar fiber domain-containing protein [Erwinia sp. 1181_3]|uniref:phage tail-collar fiber domain-containing protein n=1 Tax=Erwinia sp. 1181_3 TaxID=2605957 RepID=UPI0040583E6D
MAVKYKSVVTTAGQARIAAAMQGGTQVDIKTMVVGDGNGQPTTPSSSQTTLVHEVYRKAVNSVKVDKTHKNWLVTEVIIPASAGGFWMRELGLLAGDGTLLAVCNMAETYKPALEEGSGRTQTLRMVIAVSGSEAIALTLDDSLVFATEEYVNQQVAARNVVDEIYPVGIVTWFAQNKNPNTLFPNTTWNSIGENKTIRLAKADGSDVFTSGGADAVSLSVANLPAHGHTFSGNTSTFDYGSKTTSNYDYGTKSTNSTGAHSHSISGKHGSYVGPNNYVMDGARGGDYSVNTSTTGEHLHTVAIGAHVHTVAIGAHTHTVSGTTANTGSGTAMDITNSFIKLMGWYRSA